MTAQDGTYQRLTVAEAAAELGVSRMTVRRMIQRGQLEAERVHRPQGSLYVVLLPVDGTDQGTPTAQVPRHRARHNGTDQGTPAGQLAAWSETFLMPLVAALERSQAVVREQAETIGTLRAENAALMASHAPQDANLRPDQLGKANHECPGAVVGPPASPGAVGARAGRAGDRRRGLVAGGPVILTALAWVLVVSGAALVGAGLLAPLADRLRH